MFNDTNMFNSTNYTEPYPVPAPHHHPAPVLTGYLAPDDRNIIHGWLNAIFRFVAVILIIYKISKNYNAMLSSSRLFFVFMIVLVLGNILIGVSGAYYAYNLEWTTNAEGQKYRTVVGVQKNAMDSFGSLLVDCFFGLLPNFFYAIYKTNINKSTVSMKYFVYNYGVIGIFFVVIFGLIVSQVAAVSDFINIVLIMEILYTLGVFVFTIYTLREMRTRVRKILYRFFMYFVFYATSLIVKASYTFYMTYNSANGYSPPAIVVDAFIIVDMSYNACLTVVIILFLKELKFNSSDDRTTSSNDKSSSKLSTVSKTSEQ